jgi:hypothetical protein
MKAICTPLPNPSYDIKSFAVDAERNNVSAYAVFSATNTGWAIRSNRQVYTN